MAEQVESALQGIDLVLMAEIISQIDRGRGYALAKAFPERPSQVGIMMPVYPALWEAADVVMRRVIPHLPYVVEVKQVGFVEESGYPGWRVVCSGETEAEADG